MFVHLHVVCCFVKVLLDEQTRKVHYPEAMRDITKDLV